jgi:hypothetical protein
MKNWKPCLKPNIFIPKGIYAPHSNWIQDSNQNKLVSMQIYLQVQAIPPLHEKACIVSSILLFSNLSNITQKPKFRKKQMLFSPAMHKGTQYIDL